MNWRTVRECCAELQWCEQKYEIMAGISALDYTDGYYLFLNEFHGLTFSVIFCGWFWFHSLTVRVSLTHSLNIRLRRRLRRRSLFNSFSYLPFFVDVFAVFGSICQVADEDKNGKLCELRKYFMLLDRCWSLSSSKHKIAANRLAVWIATSKCKNKVKKKLCIHLLMYIRRRKLRRREKKEDAMAGGE